MNGDPGLEMKSSPTTAPTTPSNQQDFFPGENVSRRTEKWDEKEKGGWNGDHINEEHKKKKAGV